MAISLGAVGGLLEGVGHMVLQKLDILENSWYQIIWIASWFNGLLAGVVGLVVVIGVWLLGRRSWARHLGALLIAFAAVLPVMALLLKEWIQTYAIFTLVLGTSVAFARWFGRHEDTARRFFRRAFPWAVGSAILAFVLIQGGFWLRERVATARLPSAVAGAPNVLLIIVDTLRADHLSSAGYARRTSPALDALGNQGVVFDNAFSTASYTLPSHASILTGLYPSQHDIEWDTSHRAYGNRLATLAEVLQERGYRTGGFSSNRFYFAREHGFGRGFLHFEDYFQSITDMVLRTAYGRIAYQTTLARWGLVDLGRKRATDVNRAVLQWLGTADTNPFLVVVNYMDVHGPYTPPQPYRSRFSQKRAPGGLLNQKSRVLPKLTAEQLQDEIDAYDGSIAYVDEHIGLLVSAVEQRASKRGLLVIVTSDHGEEFGEHGGYLHDGNLYRETIHVPLIVRQEGVVPTGRRISRPVTNAAIPATIMAFLGDEVTFQGPPLQRLWMPEVPADWPLPIADLKHKPWAPERDPVHFGTLRSVMSATWHYIDNGPRAPELFNWQLDPREKVNLADTGDAQATINALRAHLK